MHVTITFDIKKGRIHFGPTFQIGAENSVEDLEAMGIKFIRDFPMSTGWVLKVGAPLLLDGQRLRWTFSFEGKKLRWIQFGLGDETVFDPQKLRILNNEFLAKQLGPPMEIKGAAAIYKYAWGTISSFTDPHNNSSSMSIKWETHSK